MIVDQLPDPNNFTNSPQKQAGNIVITAFTQGNYYYPVHQTPYMLVTNYLNKGNYAINKQRVHINEQCFYFLQPGSKLEIDFKANEALQTLMVIFTDEFILNAWRVNTTTDGAMLNDPETPAGSRFYIPQVPFYPTASMQSSLAVLRKGGAINDITLNYLLLDIMSEFCLLHSSTTKQIHNIRSAKPSTREELYRRLSTAKLFMEDNVCTSIAIDTIAKEACLNSFHFLRSFKQLYGITPHQFLLQAKLTRAYAYLSNKKYSVTETCGLVGFESIGSFSNLFKKQFGISPSSLLK